MCYKTKFSLFLLEDYACLPIYSHSPIRLHAQQKLSEKVQFIEFQQLAVVSFRTKFKIDSRNLKFINQPNREEEEADNGEDHFDEGIRRETEGTQDDQLEKLTGGEQMDLKKERLIFDLSFSLF